MKDIYNSTSFGFHIKESNTWHLFALHVLCRVRFLHYVQDSNSFDRKFTLI